MRLVTRRMLPLETSFAFVGGAVVPLLVDHPDLTEFRPTKDVDLVTQVVTLAEFYAFEEKLRRAGFRHDHSDGAPLCRWVVDECRVDIMPVDSSHLGMNSRWFPQALEFSNLADLGDGVTARIINGPIFIATKLEAYRDRGKGDIQASHDIEDIITLVDGSSTIVEQVAAAPAEARQFIARSLAAWQKTASFIDELSGHLSPISQASGRTSIVIDRITSIAQLAA